MERLCTGISEQLTTQQSGRILHGASAPQVVFAGGTHVEMCCHQSKFVQSVASCLCRKAQPLTGGQESDLCKGATWLAQGWGSKRTLPLPAYAHILLTLPRPAPTCFHQAPQHMGAVITVRWRRVGKLFKVVRLTEHLGCLPQQLASDQQLNGGALVYGASMGLDKLGAEGHLALELFTRRLLQFVPELLPAGWGLAQLVRYLLQFLRIENHHFILIRYGPRVF